MGKSSGHAQYKRYEGLHNAVGSFDGGSCVGSHEYYYKQRCSCSYRWQGHHRATTSDKALYGPVSVGFSSPSPGEAATLQRNRALATKPGALQTSKAGRDYRRVTGQPFRTAFAPWPNNPHHLLPDAQLRNGIFEMTKGETKVEDLIVQGLLKEKYNINHWKNIMILPQRLKDGCRLSLPTHPQGDSHPTWSAKIRGEVDSALSPYLAVLEQVKNGEEDHDEPDPEDIKGALEAISDAAHAGILAARATVAARCGANQDISIGGMSSVISVTPGV